MTSLNAFQSAHASSQLVRANSNTSVTRHFDVRLATPATCYPPEIWRCASKTDVRINCEKDIILLCPFKIISLNCLKCLRLCCRLRAALLTTNFYNKPARTLILRSAARSDASSPGRIEMSGAGRAQSV
jgi:hypothetical protein